MKAMSKLLYLIVIALIIVGIVYAFPKLEWHAPTIDIKLSSEYIGLRPFDIEIKDQGQGLKNASIKLINEQGETSLYQKDYPLGVKDDKVTIQLDHKTLGLKGGAVEIVAYAEDRSLLRFLSGNKTEIRKKATIDLLPPKVEVLSREHYINHGGSGLVIYKTSDDAVKSGVKVGDYFFPGVKGYFKKPDVYLAFFAYPYNVPQGATPVVIAEDAAGNSRNATFYYKLKPAFYKKSTINISDEFIQKKIAPLLGVEPTDQGEYKDFFLKVNRDLRKTNDAQIKKLSESSERKFLWHGAFSQLSNSQVEANFADARTYLYNGEEIDHQYHLGYDLAVTRQYPIEAANDGVVIFAGDLGIYGNAVIIDHGFGLNSLYGHLSSINVNVGDKITKNQSLGRSGETGLAAGDHLHYGVYLDGVAVRPVEWWDNKWINDNVLNKLKEAETEFGVAGGESNAQPEATPQATEQPKEN